MEELNEPFVNKKIVILFLEKLEKMTADERKVILKTIEFINNPIFVVNP